MSAESETVVSVVTAVHGAARPYLASAYRSLAGQVMPQGWGWQWCVQEDGADVAAGEVLPTGDPRIEVGSARRGGPAVARTMALARATGDLVKVLDADDELTPGALARDIAVLQEHPHVGWVTSRAVDLMPDGSLSGPEDPPEPGPLARGALFTHWREHRRLPVHPATLCVRTPLVHLLGGWSALPASEDTALLTALCLLAEGWFVPDVGLRYRKHPHQSTAHPDHQEGPERSARMRFIEARALALAAHVQRPEPPR